MTVSIVIAIVIFRIHNRHHVNNINIRAIIIFSVCVCVGQLYLAGVTGNTDKNYSCLYSLSAATLVAAGPGTILRIICD